MEELETEFNPPDPSRRDDGSTMPAWVLLVGIVIFFGVVIFAIMSEGTRR